MKNKEKEENSDGKKQWTKSSPWRKSRGFEYPGSEIYGGLANTWGLRQSGPWKLKNNVQTGPGGKNLSRENPYNVGVGLRDFDESPEPGVASGHLGGFSDPLMDCRECHERFRADQLIENFSKEHGITLETFCGRLEPGADAGLHRGASDSPVPPAANTILPISVSST